MFITADYWINLFVFSLLTLMSYAGGMQGNTCITVPSKIGEKITSLAIDLCSESSFFFLDLNRFDLKRIVQRLNYCCKIC